MGSMKAYIRGNDSYHKMFVDLRDENDKRVGIYRPFKQGPINKVIFLNEEQIACLGENNKVVILNIIDGRETLRHALPFTWGTCVHLPKNGLFAVYHEYEIFFVSDQDFSLKSNFNAIAWDNGSGDLRKIHWRETYSKKDFSNKHLGLQYVKELDDGEIISYFAINDIQVFDPANIDLPRFKQRARNPEKLGQHFGYYKFDLSAKKVKRFDLDSRSNIVMDVSFTEISDDENYALRLHLEEIECFPPRKKLLSFTKPQDTEFHRDCLNDGKSRFAVKRDLWRIWPPEKIETITIGWTEAEDDQTAYLLQYMSSLLSKKKCAIDFKNLPKSIKSLFLRNRYSGEHAWKNLLTSRANADLGTDRLNHHNLIHTVFETSNDAVWFCFRGGLRRVDFAGKTSPVILLEHWNRKPGGYNVQGSAPWANKYETIWGLESVVFKNGTYSIETKSKVYNINERFINSTQAEIFIDRDDYEITKCPENKANVLIKNSEIAHLLDNTLKLRKFSEAHINEALQNLTKAISDDLNSVISRVAYGSTLELTFKIGKEFLDEFTFFKKVEEEQIDILAQTENLLTTFLDELPAIVEDKRLPEIWSAYYQTEKDAYPIGAFGLFLHHLVIHDHSKVYLLRKYLYRMNGEHEDYSMDIIVPAFIERHKEQTDLVVRLGIFFGFIRSIFGPFGGKPFKCLGTLDIASSSMEPHEFAEQFLSEFESFIAIGKHERELGLEGWEKDDLIVSDISRFITDLLEGNKWEQSVAEILSAKMESGKHD